MRYIYALLAGLCLASFIATSAEALDRIRLGVIASNARGTGALPYAVAERKGFFTAQNLQVESVGLGGVEHQVKALDEGRVEITHTATPYLIQAVLKGSEAVGVIGGGANNLLTLLAKPGIKSYADLKGKTVGMSLPQDTISIATRMLLRKHGLADGDYRIEEHIGPLRAQCLEKGNCDAGAVNQPTDIQMIQRGFVRLGDSLEVIPVLQFNMLAVRRSWAARNRDLVVRFARAMGESYRFMRDPTKRNEVAALISEITGSSNDVAREMLRLYYEPDRGVMPKQGEISVAGVEKVIALLVMSGELRDPAPKADRFVDLGFLKQAGLQ